MAASVQCDTFGEKYYSKKKCLSSKKKYKGHTQIYILGQVGDLIGLTEAGFRALQMNLNVKTLDKFLQFGHNKCKAMLVSKQKVVPEFLHTKL